MTELSRAKRPVHFGLLGQCVEYSRSPEIFRALFELSGIDGEFTTFNVSPDELDRTVVDLPGRGIDAVCVTIPHKERIISYLDEIDKTADSINSVNSVKFADGKSYGMNTDVYGFSKALSSHASSLKGKHALVLGAGGAARSASLGLALDCEVRSVTLVGRDETRCKKAIDDLSRTLEQVSFSFANLSYDSDGSIDVHFPIGDRNKFDIVVNATPLGGPNVRIRDAERVFEAIAPPALYYDLNYNQENELLCAARARGITTLDGFPMLVYQALRSFALWTGVTVAYDHAINEVRKQS